MNRVLLILALSLLAQSSLAANKDEFNKDFFKQDIEWDQPNKDAPPAPKVPEVPAKPVETPSASLPPTMPVQEVKPVTTTAPASASAQSVEVKPVELIPPVIKDEFLSPGEELGKIIKDTFSFDEFEKEELYNNRKVYDYHKEPNKYFVERAGKAKENSHIPQYIKQSELTQMLFTAVNIGDVNAIQNLLKQRADINARVKETGYTPLMIAVRIKNLQVARYLITKGADINLKTKDGQAALHIAAILGLDDLFNLLLTAKADLSIKDNAKKTAIDYVPEALMPKFYMLMAQNAVNKDQALKELVKVGHRSGVKYLIEDGANINSKDDSGSTALLVAIKMNNSEIANYLLYMGASYSIKDNAGHDALYYAKINNNQKITDSIESAIAKNELENPSVIRVFSIAEDNKEIEEESEHPTVLSEPLVNHIKPVAKTSAKNFTAMPLMRPETAQNADEGGYKVEITVIDDNGVHSKEMSEEEAAKITPEAIDENNLRGYLYNFISGFAN